MKKFIGFEGTENFCFGTNEEYCCVCRVISNGHRHLRSSSWHRAGHGQTPGSGSDYLDIAARASPQRQPFVLGHWPRSFTSKNLHALPQQSEAIELCFDVV
jgi:hypothetical protein